MQQPTRLENTTILELTKNGEHELREPGTTLAPVQLEALILIDGFSTVEQIVRRTQNIAPDTLRARLAELVAKGFINARSSDSDVLDASDFFTIKTAVTDTTTAGDQTRAEADANTELLRRNGYCVNIARRPVVKHTFPTGQKPAVLVIDDDPDICKLLQMFLKMENIDTRTAGSREEIIAEFRKLPLPDMVLLDVHLTDVNGFDVLAKMRQHPVLKTLPVVMLTAEANREAVLKGIMSGADGYITKPFEIHPLLRAVKTVLGLKYDSTEQDWDYSH